MGLLDWLTDSLGNSAGAGSVGNPNSYPNNPPPPPMPPVQQTGEDVSSLAPPQPNPGAMARPPQPGGLSLPPSMGQPPPMPPGSGIPPDTGGGQGFNLPPMPPGPPGSGIPPDTSGGQGFDTSSMDPVAGSGSGAGPDRITPPTTPPTPPGGPGGPGGIGSDAARAPNQPPLPPVPLPMARPPGAGPGANAPTDVSSKNVEVGKQVSQAGQEVNWLGKLIGVKTPEEASRAGREIARGMAAAFKNAPSGVGKGKFAAFAGGVGAGMSGAQAETDRAEESQRKYIAQKILANNSNLTGQLNLARTQLVLQQAKDVMLGRGSGINSPQQLYFKAQQTANNDLDMKEAKTKLDELRKTSLPNSPELKAAEEKFNKGIEERRAQHMAAAGLDPKLSSLLGKLPGMSEDNPLSGDKYTQEAYNNLPVGGYYKDPKTGKIKQKAAAPGTAAPAQAAAGGPATPPTAAPPAAASPALPPTPPAPVTAPAGTRAAGEDEDADLDVG